MLHRLIVATVWAWSLLFLGCLWGLSQSRPQDAAGQEGRFMAAVSLIIVWVVGYRVLRFFARRTAPRI